MNKRQDDDPVALVDLLEAAAVATPGQLVDRLAERGDAVIVDALGRLAAPLPVAERLWAEQAERESQRMAELERAEEERLVRLKELEQEREEHKLERLRKQALQDRIHRIEKASGLAFWQLEAAVEKDRTQGSGRGMTYDQKAIEDAKPVGLDAVERFVEENYGALEEGDAR